jgi:hypothetical protein
MVTDVTMITEYLTTGREGTGYALLGMLGGNVGMMLLVTWLMIRRKPSKLAIAGEMLVTLTGLRPAFDAWRVASGQEQLKGEIYPAATMLAITKLMELAFEAVPGGALQAYALAKAVDEGADVSTTSIGSIIVSALCVGFQCASIVFDSDTDVAYRRKEPDYYGMVPRGVRGSVVFVCTCASKRAQKDEGVAGLNYKTPLQQILTFLSGMMINITIFFALRCFGAALLIMTQPVLLLYFTLGELALEFIRRITARDFYTNMPTDGWAAVLLGDIVARIVAIIIVSYTSVPTYRHPEFFGGVGWIGVVAMGFAASLGAAHIYTESSGDHSALDAWAVVSGLSAAWISSFAVFLLLIQKNFRRTYYSTEKTKDRILGYFTKNNTDEGKMYIHICRRAIWAPIRDDVKEWTLENWERIEHEEPSWFTPGFVSNVDDDMIPPAALRRLKMQGGGNRRRSSLGDALMGAGEGAAKKDSQVVPVVA